MRLRLSFAITLICLAGCATSSIKPVNPYGNFVANAPPVHEKLMADDAVHQLLLLYPPASTRLDLRQVSADGFGKQLVELLRSEGYALQENQVMAGVASTANTSPTAPIAKAPETAAIIPLNYVVDAVTSPNLYLVTLILGSQTITRAYVPQSETIHPAGSWVRKE